MTLSELKKHLEVIRLRNGVDSDRDHQEVDDMLIGYINDGEVTELFDSIEKWYS